MNGGILKYVLNGDTMSELKFDLDNAKKIAQAYSVSTGIYCSVLDGDANYLHCACKNQFCCFISNKHNHKICQNSHKYGCYQAERFGGRYIFFCPLGLVHWISPVTVEGVTCGSLLADKISNKWAKRSEVKRAV